MPSAPPSGPRGAPVPSPGLLHWLLVLLVLPLGNVIVCLWAAVLSRTALLLPLCLLGLLGVEAFGLSANLRRRSADTRLRVLAGLLGVLVLTLLAAFVGFIVLLSVRQSF